MDTKAAKYLPQAQKLLKELEDIQNNSRINK